MGEGRMKDALEKALAPVNDASVDRILASAFFRPRPLPAGASATVVSLRDSRRALLQPSGG
jgi:hypothetical protein